MLEASFSPRTGVRRRDPSERTLSPGLGADRSLHRQAGTALGTAPDDRPVPTPRAPPPGGAPWSERIERSATHMSNHTYRVTEIVGTSPDGIDQAIRNGIHRASQTLRALDWFEMTEVRGQIVDGQIQHWQVGLKVGFRLEDGS